MGRKTANKRKALAETKETPNKIRKTINTPLYQKINSKSPKSANKNNRKTPQKKQMNGKHRGKKLSKQIEEDDSDELNGSNDNLHDVVNSDNEIEEAEIGEVDSGEDSEIGEGDSDEEADTNEGDLDEADSDEDAATNEVDLDEEAEIGDADSDEEANTKETDSDENAESDEADSDEEADTNKADLDNEAEIGEVDSNEEADTNEVNSDDESEIEESNSDDEVQTGEANSDDKAQAEEAVSENFGVFVYGLDRTAQEEKNYTRIKNVFQDCNPSKIELKQCPYTNSYKSAFVFFNDKESQKKALEKKKIQIDGRIISIHILKRTDLIVFVKGLKSNSKVEDIFNECNIDTVTKCLHKVTNNPTGVVKVTFKDKESVMKALEKDGTQFKEQVVTVTPFPDLQNGAEFAAFVTNLSWYAKSDFFKDCQIKFYKNLRKDEQIVAFKNEDSLQKVLLKHGSEQNGRIIKVLRFGCTVTVRNMNEDTKLENVFNDCNIQSIDLVTNHTNIQNRVYALVNFKDKESLKKALSKNNTEFDGKIIYVSCEYNPGNSANSADLKNKRENNYKGYATGNYKDKEYLKKNKTEFNGKTRNAEFGYNKYKQRHSGNSDYFKPTQSSCNPESKIELLKKQLLIEELKLETQKLEQEIYEQQKSFNK